MSEKKQNKDHNKPNNMTSSPCYIDQFSDYFGIEKETKNKKASKKYPRNKDE